MKQFVRIAAAIALWCTPVLVQACDVCGCSGGGNSLGLLPLVPRHFVGLRWQLQSFNTAPHHEGDQAATETYQTIDLWGRWQPHRRLQVIGILPYTSAVRTPQTDPVLKSRGIGDASLLAQFSLLDPQKQRLRSWQHNLQLGGGVKLPTGASQLLDSAGEQMPGNLQPGTGSTDWLVSGLYALRRGNWGLSLDAIGRLSKENNQQYQYGHRFNTGIQGFWVKSIGRATFLPSAGAMIDYRQEDRNAGKWVGDTGGHAVYATLGLQAFYGNVAMNIGYAVPLNHQLNDGYVTPTMHLNAGVTWLFSSKTTQKQPIPSGIFQDVSKI